MLIRDRNIPYFFIAPSVIVMIAIVAFPLGQVVVLSFQKYNFLSDPEFVGMKNYYYILFKDPYFWTVVKNTVIWTVVSVFVQYVYSLGVALLLNQGIRMRNFFRGIMLLPWIVPPVTAGLIWLTLYDSNNGILNQIITALGFSPVDWLANSNIVLFSLMLVAIWKYSPFMIVGLLAAIQAIPEHLYEAADVDGASTIQKFIYVTFPMLLPTTTVLIVLGSIWRAGHFDLVYMLTGGGPGEASELFATYAFQKTIDRLEAGMGATVAILGVLGILVLIWYFVRRLIRE